MAVNKVEVNGETKLDLTQDTVTPENLLSGATAHNAAGERISGAVAPVRYDVAQDLTFEQQKQARDNIGAGNADDSTVVHKTGDEDVSGVKTFDAPVKIPNTEQTTTKFKTSNGGAVIIGKEAANNGTMFRLDQVDGTTRLRFRASAAAGAMIWEQPEHGAQLYIDLGDHGTGGDYHRIKFPEGYGTLAFQTDVKDKVPKSRKVNGHTLDTDVTVTKDDIGLGNVDNVKQYSADNPPPYPATTNLIKGDGAGGLAGAVPETDYASPVIMRKVTLTVAGWNSSTKQQAAAVSGVLADRTKQRVICSPVDESYDSVWNSCYVQCVGHGADSLTFQCDKIPTAAVEVFVSIQPVSFAS